jgi:hypothetical protein
MARFLANVYDWMWKTIVVVLKKVKVEFLSPETSFLAPCTLRLKIVYLILLRVNRSITPSGKRKAISN